MMSAKPRLLVPYGLKTLLEGLSRAVLRIQPGNIAQFASLYFTELLQYRDANPSLDIKDLVKEFQRGKVEGWPDTVDVSDSKRMTPQFTEKVLQDAGLFSQVSESKRTTPQLTDMDIQDGGIYSPLAENPKDRCMTGQDGLRTPTSEVETYAPQMQRTPSHMDEMTQYPSLHRDISNPVISSQGSGSIYSSLPPGQRDLGQDDEQSGRDYQEPGKVLSKPRYSSTDRSGQRGDKSPSKSRQSLDAGTSMLQDVTDKQESPNRVMSQNLHTPSGYTYEKSHQDTIPSNAGLMAEMSKTVSEGVYPPDRVISKTLQADGLPSNVDRIVSKMSHYPPPDQFIQADTSAPSAPSAPRSSISSSKQTMDSKFYLEMATTVPPTRAPSQFKEMSGAAESSQRMPKMQPPAAASVPYYELHLAVENQMDGVPHEPAYVPATESSAARIFRAISDIHTKIEPKIVQVEKPYYDAQVDMRSGSQYPDRPKTGTMPFKPPRGAPQYQPDSIQQEGEVPYYVEQIPKEILVPTPQGKRQSVTSPKQPVPQPYQAAVQQPAYRMSDSGKYHPSYQQEASGIAQQGFTDNASYYGPDVYSSQKTYKDTDEREPANMWTLYRLTDLSEQKSYSAPTQPTSPMFRQNEEQPTHWNQEYSANQPYAQQAMPSQRSNYMESQLPRGMQTAPYGAQQVVNNPAFMVSDEPKKAVTPPYILVGSKIQDANEWKPIPGHAVVSQSELNAQRKYTTVPVPLAVPTDGHSQSQGQGGPVYYSVAIPLDESHRMGAAQSFTHVTDHRQSPTYSNSQGNFIALAAAASRRPSMAGIGENKLVGFGRPPEQLTMSKTTSVRNAPDWQS
ncbi:calcium-binding tyrosine phosphorylation-regulated protein [Discoglossus pictus]